MRIEKASIKISRIRYEDSKKRRGTGLKEKRIRDQREEEGSDFRNKIR